MASIAEPRYIALAGPDVLILDSKNQLWRWRPAGSGKGSLAKVKVKGASSWGDDIRGLGAFVRNVDQGLYNLYVVDPSGKQILVYTPAFDGSGFPGDPSGWLAAPQDVSTVDTMLIDGDVYLSRDGGITRYARGGKTGWTPADPGDALLRPAPAYSVIASGTDKGLGSVYGYDRANSRVLKIDKNNGAIQAQYRLATGDPGWADLRGMIVVAGDRFGAGHAHLGRQGQGHELAPRGDPGADRLARCESIRLALRLAQGEPQADEEADQDAQAVTPALG